MLKRISFLSSLLLSLVAATAARSETQLTVYTALEAVDLKRFGEAFEADNPDIKINWVRDSTGVITAKLLAEKNNPKADVIWTLAATSLVTLKSEGILEPYAPAGLDKLDAKFYDRNTPPSWVGKGAYIATICFNTVEGAKLGLSAPKSWKDLARPEFKGHVVMPNAVSSGTGFLNVSAWLQLFGEKDGWAYMDALHQNISTYTHSGSKPCKMAGSGETVAGISYEFTAAKVKAAGGPIDVILPVEGSGWEAEAIAIVAGTANFDAAKRLADWAISKRAMELYNVGSAIVSMPGVAKPVEHLPADIASKLIDNDLEWAANHRKAILEEWAGRYDSKSEAKD